MSVAGAPQRLGLPYLLIGLAPLVFAVRGVTEHHALAPTSISHVDGASYIASIEPSPLAPVLGAASDDPSHGRRSSSRLFEDGRELGPAHALHVGIAAVGKGRFSHWTTAVYLSASDNSDPRTNGRTYRLDTVARLPLLAAVAWAATVLFAAAMSTRLWPSGEPSLAWWLPYGRPTILAVASVVAFAVIAMAGPGIARLWALASWLLVGFVAAFFAGVVVRRVSIRESVRAVADLSPALSAAWTSVGSVATSLEQRIFDRPGWTGLVARVGGVVVSVGVFVATLMAHWPEWVLAQAYGGGGRVMLAAAAALWLAHSRRGWLATLLGLTVTFGLFALPLAGLWQDVTIHFNAIGGLLPFSDAQGYYFEANRLLDGQPLVWSARRPLFTAFLAVLLAVTGSLYVALAVMVALNAAATFLLARELRLSFGALSATVATLILFAFYRHDGGTGVVLTENLGSLLGTMAFTTLLRGMRLQDTRSYLSGTVALTAALMARAGAFFVLPAVAAAAFVSLRQEGRRTSLRSALVTLGAIVIAAAAFLTWGQRLSNPTASHAAFSNYSQPLYGLVVGGKGWEQVHIDHPNAQEGAEIYALAYQAFRARPSGLIEGLAKMTRAYLWPSEPYHMFAFVQDGPRTGWLQRMCYLLVVVGLGACVWRWPDPIYALVLAAAVGHFVSIPFVPPIDAGLRVYAATTPVLALLVAAGIAVPGSLLAGLWRRLAIRTAPSVPAAVVTNRFTESAALILVAVIMGASWTLYAARGPTTLTRASCPRGSESLLVRVRDDAALRIHDDLAPRAISPTHLRQSEAQRSVGLVELKAEAHNLRTDMSLVFTYDLLDGRQVWLVGDTARLRGRSGVQQICGHYATDALARRYGLIYIDEARAARTH